MAVQTDNNMGSAKMPVLFVGHGSPMNAIETNDFSRAWKELGRTLPVPRAILCISAHWLTRGTYITAMETPRTIYDFGGFPKKLYEQEYNAPGAPEIAEKIKSMVKTIPMGVDDSWGLDHGAWTVLKNMYPKANIPVMQLSIDLHRPPLFHYELGQELKKLRMQGVLILGSGNLVHNLHVMYMNDEAYPWALEFDKEIKSHIMARNVNDLVDYTALGSAALMAIPTPDHYYPFLYTLGAANNNDTVTFYTEKVVMGSISMRCVQFG